MARSKNAEREAREARARLRRFSARQGVHNHQVRRRRRDNLFSILGAVIVATLATVTQVVYFSSSAETSSPTPSASFVETPAGENLGDIPDPSAAESRSWTGTLTLNQIPIGIELDGARAPQAVAAFVQQVSEGYFVGKTCHRLTTENVRLIQCGSLDGTGAGDPAFQFGPIENAPADFSYPAGTIAMARAGGDAYSQGHQFFIMLEDGTLPNDAVGGYTIFGTVTSGLDQVISGIADAGTADGSGDGPPAVATTITAITIE